LVVLGAVFGAVRVLGGAKQTSKGLAWCRVLSKGVKFGVKFNKQGFWCLVLCLVLCGAKLTSKGFGAKVWCFVWVLSKDNYITPVSYISLALIDPYLPVGSQSSL
jgi:hypothetical protein